MLAGLLIMLNIAADNLFIDEKVSAFKQETASSEWQVDSCGVSYVPQADALTDRRVSVPASSCCLSSITHSTSKEINVIKYQWQGVSKKRNSTAAQC